MSHPALSPTNCFRCGAPNAAGNKHCCKCDARLPLHLVAAPSRLDLKEDNFHSPLPPHRYESEVLHNLSWAIYEYLAGELESDEVQQALEEADEAFAQLDAGYDELNGKLSDLESAHPEEKRIPQARYFGTRGIELFREGLESLGRLLEADAEDEVIWKSLRTLLDGNDYISHCYVLLQGDE